MSLWAHWFEAGERRIRSVDPDHWDSWRCDAITWDEHRPEAFAGFHNAGRRIIYGFDEAAAIADSIFWGIGGHPCRCSGYRDVDGQAHWFNAGREIIGRHQQPDRPRLRSCAISEVAAT